MKIRRSWINDDDLAHKEQKNFSLLLVCRLTPKTTPKTSSAAANLQVLPCFLAAAFAASLPPHHKVEDTKISHPKA